MTVIRECFQRDQGADGDVGRARADRACAAAGLPRRSQARDLPESGQDGWASQLTAARDQAGPAPGIGTFQPISSQPRRCGDR